MTNEKLLKSLKLIDLGNFLWYFIIKRINKDKNGGKI